MKKIIFLILVLSCLNSMAERFMRFNMNDQSYHGFYTNTIEFLTHDNTNGKDFTKVITANKTHLIPVEDLDYISFEDVDIENGDPGEYRIYEFNFEDSDVKKIYVDNRACLFASKSGEFGSNDEILFSSAYNDVKCIFYTDDEQRITKIFDGEKLLIIDYDFEDENEIAVYDMETGETRHYKYEEDEVKTKAPAPSNPAAIIFFEKLAKSAKINFLGDFELTMANSLAGRLAEAVNDVGNNPELHNQMFIVDGLSIAGDITGIALSLLAEVPSGGLSTAGLAVSSASLINDLKGLADHIWPDYAQMERYKEYYGNKYNITLNVLNPENLKCDSADLTGTFMSLNGIKGDLYFMVRESSEYDNYEKVSVTTEGLTANSYIVKGHVGNLKLDELYFYDLMYEIVVDGLSFQYKSESSYFWTLKPIATTLDVVSVTTTSATVECSFENVPEGAICGVQYDGDKVIRTTATDGRKTFTISGLKSNTTYYYRAFIQINGKNFYGDMETLKTEATEADKFVGMWKGTQFLPNGSTNGGGSYLYLNQDGTAIFENNATKGTWSYEGASVTVNLEPVPGAWGFPLVKIIIEGTLDDVDNPTQMTGQITYYNEWGEHQTNTFVFYPV